MRYLAGRRDTIDPRETDPLHVPDDGGAHAASVHRCSFGSAISRAAPVTRFTP
jgi:hypothetical protein